MGDGSDYYTDSDPSDWDYQDGSVRRQCVVCLEMFMCDPDDEPPICDGCWFDTEEYKRPSPEADDHSNFGLY